MIKPILIKLNERVFSGEEEEEVSSRMQKRNEIEIKWSGMSLSVGREVSSWNDQVTRAWPEINGRDQRVL